MYHLNNNNIEDTIKFVYYLWIHQGSGGLLSYEIIQLMIKLNLLIKNGNFDNIKGSSYDLTLGDEYYNAGKIKTLSDKEPFILIEPYDYAIVTSKEKVIMPNDIASNFGLSVSLFCQGIILSNGPQVDPGFRGILLCLLFNTSDVPVLLKRGEHYATIIFNKLIEPTFTYSDTYQDKDKIKDYLPTKTMMGGINVLKKELEDIKNQSRSLQDMFLGVISLILSIIAILLALR